jgi:hypothetical protein
VTRAAVTQGNPGGRPVVGSSPNNKLKLELLSPGFFPNPEQVKCCPRVGLL